MLEAFNLTETTYGYIKGVSMEPGDFVIQDNGIADSRGGLGQEGVLMESVGCVAVEGTRFHRHSLDIAIGLLCQVERLQHPEA